MSEACENATSAASVEAALDLDVGDKAPDWNAGYRLQALRHLITTLPDASMPVPKQAPRPLHRIAKQLKGQQVKDLIQAYEAGATVYELGDRFGIERRTVSKILKREGIETRWRRLTDEDVDEAVRLYATGLSAARIADRFNVSDDAIRYQLKKRGVTMRDPHERL